MGSSQSSASIRKISNDFELVIRATKELEFMLETEFDAPTGKTIGLHEKISDVEHSFGLSRPTVQKMRYLVTGAYHSYLFLKLDDISHANLTYFVLCSLQFATN